MYIFRHWASENHNDKMAIPLAITEPTGVGLYSCILLCIRRNRLSQNADKSTEISEQQIEQYVIYLLE